MEKKTKISVFFCAKLRFHEGYERSSERARSQIHCHASQHASLSHRTSTHVPFKSEVEALTKTENHFARPKMVL